MLPPTVFGQLESAPLPSPEYHEAGDNHRTLQLQYVELEVASRAQKRGSARFKMAFIVTIGGDE